VGERRYWGFLSPMPAAILAELARAAEAQGLAGVFAAQVYGPPWIPLAAAAATTQRLKLASGIAMPDRLLKAGVNVGLGTDGAASNNRLDLFTEMRLAALLAKGTTDDPTALPAHTALEMATVRAARALGMEERIGTLAPGKFADMTAVDLGALELLPCYDPLSHLVYAAGREHVSHVWVNGELVVENGRLTRLDTTELAAKTAYWREKIRSQDE